MAKSPMNEVRNMKTICVGNDQFFKNMKFQVQWDILKYMYKKKVSIKIRTLGTILYNHSINNKTAEAY